MELVDEWLAEGEASGYFTYVLADDEAPHPVRGYVCFGPAPMTDGTFDLYWIAVDPDDQGRGFGGRLLAAAEEEVRARGGRLLLIETASQASYAPTVRFYERAGYTIVSRIRDYYRPGDDKLVFAKHFAA
jgi:ribosomal protein S18 acetylase RimI-like enzyme